MNIRPATPGDCELIRQLIRELADYEKLAKEVSVQTSDLSHYLFGDQPCAEVLIAELGDEAAGFALFFPNYSTFTGRPGIYIEDVYVRTHCRRQGVGKALFSRIAGLAVARGCARLEWSVLNWNSPALEFYQSIGARPMQEWTTQRLTGERLKALARS